MHTLALAFASEVSGAIASAFATRDRDSDKHVSCGVCMKKQTENRKRHDEKLNSVRE